MVAAVLLVAAFLAFELDIYVTEGSTSTADRVLELDEALTLGALLTVSMLVFAIRRYLEQKRETSRRIAAEQEARTLAYEDVLTGLPNRRRFDEALAAAIAAPPAAGKSHAVFLLDLNGFKRINDVHGHGVGDEALTVVARQLQGAVRDGDLVSRFGGDEFAILAQHLLGAEAATNVALRVIQSLAEPVRAGEALHRLGTGIGIALLPGDADTAAEALRKADVALYRAKAEGRSALRFFETEMDRHVREREALEEALRTAIAEDQVRPGFRPTVDLRSGRITGFEAMPRWRHPELGEVPPERFLPIAEESGLIAALSDRVMRLACEAAQHWPAEVTLSLQLLPSQLNDRGLVQRVAAMLEELQVAPSRLELEIAESTLVGDMQQAQLLLGALRAIGVRIALGNFGTGYSSLYHLRNFKLDKIKIDRGFVEGMRSEGENARIVSALVGLGQGLGLTVTADGIGDAEQRAALLGTGCEEGQGLLFSDGMSAEDATRLLGEAVS
ncbi:putative bifunctional diguanylate cyclase/phosphodiesterase [Roseomonas sp. BN140053]|uniref:putative bifunctional diguanylate cyclase/phosphodiesterase n=1 Tax=Roseomonas sp. BN140053 TaxID=3391898 RepID=UPI0039E90E57